MTSTRRQLLTRSLETGVGLNLAGLLAARACGASIARTEPARIRSCIVVFYYGGPSHLDTWDMKPDAPAEVRGEFQSIATSVPGLRIGEHLPRMARVMDRVTIIRSMHHTNRLHDSASTETLTGRQSPQGDREEFAAIPQFFPSLGATLAYANQEARLPVPYAALPWKFHNVIDVPCQGGGFLGSRFDPFLVRGDPQTVSYRAEQLDCPPELTETRLQARRHLLAELDGPHSRAARPTDSALDALYEKAYELLGSQRIRDALDLSREPQAVRERYGHVAAADLPTGPAAGAATGRTLRGPNLLMARRLVEAGVPFVNVYDFRQQGQNWDSHNNNFDQHRRFLLPPADQALSALIEDLEQRGLLDSTLVVALGEFGRTPRINANAGRDHWPDCYSILLAGGGVRPGFVYGASDRTGAYPDRDGVTPGDLAATIFWAFGLDHTAHVRDRTGRPYRLADGEPLRQLFG